MNISEKNGCIYLITNILNERKYIGQSHYIDPQKRWATHLRSSKNNSPYAVHSAIRKYGKENFKIERLCVCPYSALGNMESYYAEQYGTYVWDPEPGYNMVWCGENFRRGITHTQEVREKLSKSHIGKIQSKETIAKRIEASTGQKRSKEACNNIKQGKLNKPISEKGINNIVESKSGKKMSDEARKNMREARKKAKLSKVTTTESPNKIKQTYSCTHEDCKKNLSSKASLKLHLRTHTGEKPFKCTECQKKFAVGSNLDAHMFTHSDERPHKCNESSECNSTFKTERALRIHIKNVHLVREETSI